MTSVKSIELFKSHSDKPSVVKMTIPVFIEYLLAMLVGNVDQIMISKYSENCVTAIGNANQVLNLLVLSFTIISTATTILVSQYIGAGQKDKVKTTYTLAVVVNTVFSVFISLVLLFGNDIIFNIMHIEESVKHEFKLYLSIVGGFIFLQGIFTTFSSILKSNAYMKEVMFMSALMNVTNILVNAMLIYGIGPFPKLGILGVAIGTIVGRLCAVVGIIVMYYKKIGVSLSMKNLNPFPTAILKKMLFIGIPSGGESVSYNITQLVTMTLINTFGQDDANAKIYCSMFAMVSWIFASSISQAVQILIGYCIGEKNYDEANNYVKSTLKIAGVVTLIVAIMLRLVSEPLLSFVTTNNNIIQLGKTILAIDIILEFGRSTNITMVRSLQATGDITFPIAIGIVSTWTISVGLSFVFGKFLGLGIIGVWIAMTCDECLRAIIFLLRWKTGKWKTKDLIS